MGLWGGCGPAVCPIGEGPTLGSCPESPRAGRASLCRGSRRCRHWPTVGAGGMGSDWILLAALPYGSSSQTHSSSKLAPVEGLLCAGPFAGLGLLTLCPPWAGTRQGLGSLGTCSGSRSLVSEGSPRPSEGLGRIRLDGHFIQEPQSGPSGDGLLSSCIRHPTGKQRQVHRVALSLGPGAGLSSSETLHTLLHFPGPVSPSVKWAK